MCELQRHLWSADVRLNAAYLAWKYERNPYLPEPLIYLAFVGDALVGMRGMLGTEWEAGDPPRRFVLPYPDDLVVDPAHRNRGLHRIIMQAALEDLAALRFDHVVNLSASPITAQASLHMGWRNAGSVRPCRIRSRRKALSDRCEALTRRMPLGWRLADRIAAHARPSGERLFDLLDAQPQSRRGGVTAAKSPQVAAMSALVARLPWDGRIRHVRDAAYFQWRFGNPLCEYRFLYAGSEPLRGYLVLHRSRMQGAHHARASIVDWEAETDEIRAQLLHAAIDLGRFPELYVWESALPRAAVPMLARARFEPDSGRSEKAILVRATRETATPAPWMLGTRRLDDANDWDLRMLYSMAG